MMICGAYFAKTEGSAYEEMKKSKNSVLSFTVFMTLKEFVSTS